MMKQIDTRRTVRPLLLLAVMACLSTGCNMNPSIPGGRSVDVADVDANLTSDDLVLVKFGATWCGPCREIEKELDTLDADKLGVKIVKVDVDEQQQLADKYNVGGIPHLTLIRGGKTLEERTGYQSADELQQWIKSFQPIN